MKRRITLSILLLGVVLVIVVPGILANGNNTVATQDSVEIYNCTATPYTVKVSHGGNLHWVVRDKAGEDQDQAQYTVDFGSDTNNNPISGARPILSAQLNDKTHKVNVPTCTWMPGRKCADFKYKLTQAKPSSLPTDCPDPIVRVVPPSLIELVLQNLVVSLTGLITLILVVSVAYKILARNHASSLR